MIGLLPAALIAASIAACAAPAAAHFQEIIPSADIAPNGGAVSVDLVFTHPMERGPAMEMAKPARLGVRLGKAIVDLLPGAKEAKVDGKTAWRATHDLKEPGNAIFFVEPQPYWEPAEGKFIVHYAKVVVDAFSAGEGWDALLGLPVEIEPLVRPYGLWTGNLFRGIVRRAGKPVPYAEIEVEWKNDGSVTPPADAFVTQVIKADANGAFAYAMPRAGWWGFAALVESDRAMRAPTGKQVPVELGGLIWVRATDMK